jgi:glycine oxidase
VSVAVVGGGIIGLAIAWRLAQRGVDVRVYDPAAGDGAWLVAAGMLAPSGELGFGQEALGRLMAESARRWPGFAASLAAETGMDLGYDDAGTLRVAVTADDAAEATRLWRYQGLTPMRTAELRALEPALSPRVRAGAHAPDDRQVDPRLVVAALRKTGVRVIGERVDRLTDLDATTVVVAAGCGTAALTGLPVRPVKGQVIRLRGEPGLLRHVVSAHVDGSHVYLVPRADGEIVVGATQEERSDRAITAGGVLGLLRAAIELVPALAEIELVEAVAGHRPGTPDNAPLLGALDERTVVAAGHFRNGVLLAPVTADLIADLVRTGRADPLLEPFAPRRQSCA